MRGRIIATLLLFGCFYIVSGQSLSNKGRNFLLTFPPNYHNNYNSATLRFRDSLQIYIVAEGQTFCSISYRNRTGKLFTDTFSIAKAGNIYTFRVPAVGFELEGFNQSGTLTDNNQNEVTAPQSFRITADGDVTVFALSQAETTSDAAMILPVSALGLRYVAACYNSDGKLDYQYNLTGQSTPSQFAIVASEDSTHITIRPSVATHRFGKASQNIFLHSGDAYLVQAWVASDNIRGDLTGTEIIADKPIAVFGGQQRATLPIESAENLFSRDMLFEQIPPIESWGKLHIVSPFAQSANQTSIGSDIYRVVAAYDNTEIFINGAKSAILNKGQKYDAPLNAPAVINTTQPTIVAEYKKSAGDAANSSRVGDPLMIIVPPREQYLTAYRCMNIQAYSPLNGASKPDTAVYSEHYISIVIPKRAVNSLQIDGKPADISKLQRVSTSYSAGLCTEMLAGWTRVGAGAHTITADEPFALMIYGYGLANSYGYTGGISLNKNADVKPVKAMGATRICSGDTAQLGVIGGIGGYTWQPSASLSCSNCPNPIARPTKTTTYRVTSFDAGDCPLVDSATIVVSFVSASVSPDTVICPNGAAQLKVTGDKLTCKWSPDYSLSCSDCPTPTATPEETTKYFVTITNSDGCSTTDSVLVNVSVPFADAGRDTAICKGGSVRLNANNGDTYYWFPASGLSCVECPNPIATPDASTKYFVTITNNAGCSATDSVFIDVIIPLADAGRDTVICKGDSVRLSASGGGEYTWFPPVSLSCTDCPNPIASPLQTTTYTVTVINDFGCTAQDSVIVEVNDTRSRADFTTEICVGNTVSLLASTGKSYSWSPPDGLSCTDCSNPVATPNHTTTYTVEIDNSSGCKAIENTRVVVRECSPEIVNFGRILSCDNPVQIIYFVNREDTAALFFGLRPLDTSFVNFRLDYYAPLPIKLNPGDSTAVKVVFLAIGDADITARYRFISSYDTLRECTVNGTSYTVPADFSLELPNGSVTPGEEVTAAVRGESQYWKQAEVTELHAEITWKKEHFIFNPKNVTLGLQMPRDWSIMYEQIDLGDSTKLIFDCGGITPILLDGDIFRFPVLVMLGGKEYPGMDLRINLNRRKKCVITSAASDSLRIFSCALPFRYVKGYGKSYFLRVAPMPAADGEAIKVEYGVGIASNSLVEIFSVTGKMVATLASGSHAAGEYSVEIPSDFLPTGTYYCRLLSGEFIGIAPVIISE